MLTAFIWGPKVWAWCTASASCSSAEAASSGTQCLAWKLDSTHGKSQLFHTTSVSRHIIFVVVLGHWGRFIYGCSLSLCPLEIRKSQPFQQYKLNTVIDTNKTFSILLLCESHFPWVDMFLSPKETTQFIGFQQHVLFTQKLETKFHLNIEDNFPQIEHKMATQWQIIFISYLPLQFTQHTWKPHQDEQKGSKLQAVVHLSSVSASFCSNQNFYCQIWQRFCAWFWVWAANKWHT